MPKHTKILMLENEIEAQRFSAILDEDGIPHRLVSYHDSAYDGLFQSQFGWGHLEANEEDGDLIKRLYHEFRGSET